MTRNHYVREQRKTLEEIDNVAAIKVFVDKRGLPTAASGSFGIGARLDETGMPADELYAFAEARWQFVEPTDVKAGESAGLGSVLGLRRRRKCGVPSPERVFQGGRHA